MGGVPGSVPAIINVSARGQLQPAFAHPAFKISFEHFLLNSRQAQTIHYLQSI